MWRIQGPRKWKYSRGISCSIVGTICLLAIRKYHTHVLMPWGMNRITASDVQLIDKAIQNGYPKTQELSQVV